MADLTTPLRPFEKLYAANVTAASITNPTPSTTAPTGDGVFNMALSADAGLNAVQLVFYGTRTSADNETFTARVTGYRKVGTLWVPFPLLALSMVQGTSVGVAGADVVATEYFADTIAVTSAFTSLYEVSSPADNTIAYVTIDPVGCRYLRVDLAKGTNASCNVLAAGF